MLMKIQLSFKVTMGKHSQINARLIYIYINLRMFSHSIYIYTYIYILIEMHEDKKDVDAILL